MRTRRIAKGPPSGVEIPALSGFARAFSAIRLVALALMVLDVPDQSYLCQHGKYLSALLSVDLAAGLQTAPAAYRHWFTVFPAISPILIAVLAISSLTFLLGWTRIGARMAGSWWWLALEAVVTLGLLAGYGFQAISNTVIVATLMLLSCCGGRRGTITGVVIVAVATVSIGAGVVPYWYQDPGKILGVDCSLARPGAFVPLNQMVSGLTADCCVVGGAYVRRLALSQERASRLKAWAQAREAVALARLRTAEDVHDGLSKTLSGCRMMAVVLVDDLVRTGNVAMSEMGQRLAENLTKATSESRALLLWLRGEASIDLAAAGRLAVAQFAQSAPGRTGRAQRYPASTGERTMTRTQLPSSSHRLSAEDAADLTMTMKVVSGIRLAIIVLIFAIPGSRTYSNPAVASNLPAIMLASAVAAAFSVAFLVRWDKIGEIIAESWWWPLLETLSVVTLVVTYGVEVPVGALCGVTLILGAIGGGRRTALLASIALAVVAAFVVTGSLPTFDNGTSSVALHDVSMIIAAVVFLIAGLFWRRLLLGQGRASRAQALAESREAASREQVRAAGEAQDRLSTLLDEARALTTALTVALADADQDESSALARHLDDGLSTATRELGALSFGLRDELPADLGLACQSVVATFMRSAPSVQVRLALPDDYPGVTPTVRDEIVRALPELLENARQHGHATAIDVAVECTAGEVTLRVTDDGVGLPDGFDLTEFARAGHFGLIGIRDRAMRIGGSFEIGSHPGGTIATQKLKTEPENDGGTL